MRSFLFGWIPFFMLAEVVLAGNIGDLPTETFLAEDLDGAAIPIEPPPKIWAGGVEAGFNGSTGNTERFNLRFGANVKRKTDFSLLTSSILYSKTSTDGKEAENKALWDARHEWFLNYSRWSVYAYGSIEYDEFQAWDLRFSAGGGLGYHFIKNDHTLLAGRVGAGFSSEVGGPEDETVPEANFGLDFEHQLTERQKISTTIDYYPDLTHFHEFRLQAKATWEIVIDPVHHLSLKVGVVDRYDSTPQGRKHNDLDYFGLLAWSF